MRSNACAEAGDSARVRSSSPSSISFSSIARARKTRLLIVPTAPPQMSAASTQESERTEPAFPVAKPFQQIAVRAAISQALFFAS